MKKQTIELAEIWEQHHQEWRDHKQITSQWQEANETDPKLLEYEARGDWWDVLERCSITLLITREYEHLLMGMQVKAGKPRITYTRMPHPSGLTVDRDRGIVHIASTRNPNQIYDLMPVRDTISRLDIPEEKREDRPLIPVRSRFYPGCLYIHDLAIIGGNLYANAVGQNAIALLKNDGTYRRVWHPHCIEKEGEPIFGQNHIQLNSIAVGETLETSYFSASCAEVSTLRPGHPDFPVDGRGVIFSGKTREPIVRGLTRPHSARLCKNKLWVDNSGYGELGIVEDGKFAPISTLPGWTRGLCFYENIAFVGTSRVIPRFRQYAPGLDVEKSICSLHAVDVRSGNILGSLIFPYGNQIFALDWVNCQFSSGFPFLVGEDCDRDRDTRLFYSFITD
ncbi:MULTISPECIES: DUF4915 domain-containing protein [Spirulina sp. CCY15215]|uniref:DUF4915 domain-containing protein n=1 Tax=Spirulina sp. CCY15215 TaxID=2767591 RepID=UPI0019506504|nr:DUF4915 domain-containing protein [Spirulina major]